VAGSCVLPDAQLRADYGPERLETGRQKAERVVQEELEPLGWDEDALRARRKGHGAKVGLARRLRQETTMSLKWIAQRLHMGSWTCASNVLPVTHPVSSFSLSLPIAERAHRHGPANRRAGL
jgi:hypothetical protein